jgi:hypothetical protein
MDSFEVRATSKATGKEFTLRRFDDQQAAIAHALGADMNAWDDVWVAPVQKPPAEFQAPKFPWAVEWVHGRAYVVDADGRKIASLLGSQQQREFVAAIIYERCERL